jgi:hypothetical protein
MNHPPRIIAKPRPSIPVLVALTILATAVALLIVIAAAAATPACMTQAEARLKFPQQHLWWHTLHRCWDDRGPVRPIATRPAPRQPIDANANRAELADVHWYPRGFEFVDPIDPPVIVGVVEYRWPGSTVMDGPVTILEPITVVAAAEFNEIDERADH